MNYRFLFPFLAAILPFCGYAQQPSFGELADSCFTCLAAGDTLNFNRLYPRIADAYERETDSAAYALRHELTTMHDYLDGEWDLEAYKRSLPVIEQKYKAFAASRKTAE